MRREREAGRKKSERENSSMAVREKKRQVTELQIEDP